MTQLITAQKLTKSEMRAIQGGGETAPAPRACDNAAGHERDVPKTIDWTNLGKTICFPDGVPWANRFDQL